MTLRTQAELQDLFITELQNRVPALTDFSEGSINEGLSGATTFTVSEIARLVLNEFSKTFFDSASGSEVTGGDDELQILAIDHFGPEFSRPGSSVASGSVTFSRATTAKGNVVITAGSIVTTSKNASGQTTRFKTLTTGTLTGLTLTLTVEALDIGIKGNVSANTIKVIETALTDATVSVNNAVAISGGADPMSDSDYREYIRSKLTTLKAGIPGAIEAAALTVAGIVTAKAIEIEIPVIEYDIATSLPKVGAKFFRIPKAILYISTLAGTASQLQIDAVKLALKTVKAIGTYVEVAAAQPLLLNWSAVATLNPGGPNYALFSGGNFTLIKDAMAFYIATLPVGTSFIKATADLSILALFGPLGTNDLTVSGFATVTPAANVSVTAEIKIVPDVMGVS